MSHLLGTMNAPAAAAANGDEKARLAISAALDDLPMVGEPIVFWPRPGDTRAGRNHFPALVSQIREDGSLDVIVFYDADDVVGQERVVPRVDNERGWTWPRALRPANDAGVAALRADVLALQRAVLALMPPHAPNLVGSGDHVRPDAVSFVPDVPAVQALQADLDQMAKTIFGDFAAPSMPIVEILLNYDNRLDKLETTAKRGPKPSHKAKPKG